MKLLLDTHVLIWVLTASRTLPASLLRLIDDDRNEVYFSPVSIFETASKRAARSRSAPRIDSATLAQLARDSGFVEVGINSSHGAAVETIALFHPDPFDRLLLAQAQVEGLQLVTHDETLAQYDSRTIVF